MKSSQSRKTGSAAWRTAEQEGYDMSLVESNLRKTPHERIRAHSRALATARMLRRAMEERHATDYGQLDCLGDVKGIGAYNQVARCSVVVNLPFGPCRVLGIDALILSKEAMDRPRDRAAIVQLRAIKERSRRSG